MRGREGRGMRGGRRLCVKGGEGLREGWEEIYLGCGGV